MCVESVQMLLSIFRISIHLHMIPLLSHLRRTPLHGPAQAVNVRRFFEDFFRNVMFCLISNDAICRKSLAIPGLLIMYWSNKTFKKGSFITKCGFSEMASKLVS